MDQGANAFGSTHLVTRQRERIGVRELRQRDLAYGLNRIHVQPGAQPMRDLGDLADRLEHAGLVVGRGNGNHGPHPLG
jgi:hypothetical protein